MFPAYHNYRNICAQQLSVELLRKFTVFDCLQNFSLLSLRQGGPKAASGLQQEVRGSTFPSLDKMWHKGGKGEASMLWAFTPRIMVFLLFLFSQHMPPARHVN